MRIHTIPAAVLGLATALALLTGCDPSSTDSASPAPTGTPVLSIGVTTPDATTSAPAKAVPKLTGMDLQAAQDAAQAAGFADLTSHDSAGRDRQQLLDRDWKVCSQKPAAGTKTSQDTQLDFGTVKTGETCPATDQKPPAKAGKTMPDFVVKGLNTATAAFPAGTSIDLKDAGGQDRIIVLQSNWKVCTQSPAAGAPLSGQQPVKFTAVKFEESCP